MATFTHEELRRIFERARDANLQDKREELLAGIPKAIAGSIRKATNLVDQVWLDLHHLDEIGILADGARPLKTWLDNAATLLSALRKEHEFFFIMARRIASPSPPDVTQATTPPQLFWYSQKRDAGTWVVCFSDSFEGSLRFAQRLSNGRVIDADLSSVAEGIAVIAVNRDAVDVLVSQEAVTVDDMVLPLKRSPQPLSRPAPSSRKPSGRA